MEQELGNGWAEGVHPEDLPYCLETYRSSFKARKPFTMEYRLRNAQAEYRWVLDNGIPRYTQGQFAGYIGSSLDISEPTPAYVRRRRLRDDALVAVLLLQGC